MPRRPKSITGQRVVTRTTVSQPVTTVNKAVKRILNRSKETDHYNYSITSDEVTSTAEFFQVFSPAQGDGEKQRIGDAVEPQYCRFKFYLNNGTTSTQTNRIVLFQWRPDNDIDAPSITKILETSTDPHSDFIYGQARKKFRVLFDGYYVLRPTANYNNPIVKDIKIGKKRLSRVRFNDGAVSGRNNLYLLQFGNYGAGVCSTIGYYITTAYKEV